MPAEAPVDGRAGEWEQNRRLLWVAADNGTTRVGRHQAETETTVHKKMTAVAVTARSTVESTSNNPRYEDLPVTTYS